MLKNLLRRIRHLLLAEVLAELEAVKTQLAARDEKIEAALLTIALAKKDEDSQ